MKYIVSSTKVVFEDHEGVEYRDRGAIGDRMWDEMMPRKLPSASLSLEFSCKKEKKNIALTVVFSCNWRRLRAHFGFTCLRSASEPTGRGG